MVSKSTTKPRRNKYRPCSFSSLEISFRTHLKKVRNDYTVIVLRDLADGTVYYPLLITKSTLKLQTLVFQWFDMAFGTRLTPLRLPSSELSWILLDWAMNVHAETTTKPLELTYTTVQETVKDITVTMPMDSVFEILKHVPKQSSESNEDDVHGT